MHNPKMVKLTKPCVNLSFFFLFLLMEKVQNCHTTSIAYSKSLSNFIPSDYNPLIPPPDDGGQPTKVNFSVIVMNVRDVHETTQELCLEMNLRIHWIDIRLKNLTNGTDCLVLNPNSVNSKIWMPDIFISYVKSIGSPALMSKPASLRLYQDGALRYSERVNIVQSCHMNFRYYPADIQKCSIEMKSYAYTTDILVLDWQKGTSATLADNLKMPNFVLGLENPSTTETVSSSGTYSGIKFTISLKRKLSYHLLQTYLPSTLFIFVSWLTFIIPQDSGALPLCMTLLLTITAMYGAVRSSTPTASYAKAIDIWMVACMMFIFTSLAQHAITLRLRHMKARKCRDRQNNLEMKNTRSKSVVVPILKKLNFSNAQNTDVIDQDPTVYAVSYRTRGKDSLQMNNAIADAADISQENDINKRYSKEPPNVPTSPSPCAAEDEEPGEKLVKQLKVLGNKIRQVFSFLSVLAFMIFNFVYWTWLIRSSGYND